MEPSIPRINTSQLRNLFRGALFFKHLPVKEWGLLLLSGFFIVATILLSFALPLTLRIAINTLEQHQTTGSVAWALVLLTLYAAAWLARQITIQAREICAFSPFAYIARIMSQQAFAHMLKLPLSFHLHRRLSTLTGIFKKAQQTVPLVYSTIFWWVIPLLIESAGAVTIVFKLFGGFFAIVLALTLVCYGMCISYFADITRIYRQKFMDLLSRSDTQIVDSLLHAETVKAFNQEAAECQRVAHLGIRTAQASEKASTVHTSMHLAEAVILGLGITAFSMKAASLVVHKTFTIGDFVLLHGYVLQFAHPLSTLGHLLRYLQVGLIDLGATLDLLDVKPAITDRPQAHSLAVSKGAITFSNVSFGYLKNTPIVRNISLSIKPGSTVGIVGASGGGKSTIARLLTRQYDISSGSITIDGQSIHDVTLKSLRTSIALVPQECTLFNNSIFYNIAYGNPKASPDEVLSAAKAAQLEPVITTLPRQYETLIGERGIKLSGGERQRVAIARALLKRPTIYIFDEATASLDNQTERTLQEEIRTWCQGATTIIIAHRLSTVAHADMIIYIDEGTIAEQGTHEELIAHKGKYAALWDHQQGGTADA